MASGMSAFELGRSRMWPTQESTTKPLGRYCWIFFDFVGDSTMTSFLPAPAAAEASASAGDLAMRGGAPTTGVAQKAIVVRWTGSGLASPRSARPAVQRHPHHVRVARHVRSASAP